MNLNEMFPSNYLNKTDLPAPRVLVMSNVTKEEVWRKNGKQVAIVLHFQNSKPMVLNKTNAIVIARIYGPDTAAWIGKPIGIYHDPGVMLGRERVGGIRLRAPGTQQPVEQNGQVNKAGDGRTVATPLKKIARKAPPGDVEVLAGWIAYEKCDLAKILAHYGITAIGDIPDNVFDDCMAKVKAKFPGFMPENPSGEPVPAQAKFPASPTTAMLSRPMRACD